MPITTLELTPLMSSSADAYDALREVLSPQGVLRRNEPLASKTTLRVGGPADVYVEPASEEELAAVVRLCAERSFPMVMLGLGSNLLIRDRGIRGVVVSLAQPFFSRIEVDGERMRCGAGARLKAVANEARRQGLAGFEFLEGIPGSIGGALRMNAGAMGSATFEIVESMRAMDRTGAILERRADEITVKYRGCPLLKTHIALGAVLHGKPDAADAIRQRMDACAQKRWSSQPKKPSAGCIFKNPPQSAAGRIVDELGLKGSRVGGAVVSAEHGNFIVNDGGATAKDVLELIEVLKEKVRLGRGVELETEVEILGED